MKQLQGNNAKLCTTKCHPTAKILKSVTFAREHRFIVWPFRRVTLVCGNLMGGRRSKPNKHAAGMIETWVSDASNKLPDKASWTDMITPSHISRMSAQYSNTLAS
eukprot:4633414-Amphidinium_carterae.1